MNPPGIELRTTAEKVVAELKVDGIKAKSLEVLFEDSTLTIRGIVRKLKTGGKSLLHDRTHHEWEQAGFARSVEIPVPVVSDKASAACFSGVLRITFPRAV